MTDTVTEFPAPISTPAAAPVIAAESAADAAPGARARKRGGRGGQRGQTGPQGGPPRQPEARARAPQPRAAQRAPHPVLEKLFELYPALFGARFRPLKLGVYQELLALHPDAFKKEDLKVALGLHARSTRYLEAVASGEPRHDLSGAPLEPVAPEHVQHAIFEVFRRRQARSKDDLRPWLHSRLVAAIEASGLPRDDYMARMPNLDDMATAALGAAFAELGERAARREALRRAYEASGKTVAEFADMYGMDETVVRQALGAGAAPVA